MSGRNKNFSKAKNRSRGPTWERCTSKFSPEKSIKLQEYSGSRILICFSTADEKLPEIRNENLAPQYMFIRALLFLCVKVGDSWIVEASKAFIIQSRFPRKKHNRGKGKYA